jgi:hypothetical protein
MRIVILITAIEMSALMLWMIYKHYRRARLTRLIPAESTSTQQLNQRSSVRQSTHYPLMSDSGEGQRDDRRPMDGSVSGYGETITPSERSFARRAHQAMYKRWSQERHDSHGPIENKPIGRTSI